VVRAGQWSAPALVIDEAESGESPAIGAGLIAAPSTASACFWPAGSEWLRDRETSLAVDSPEDTPVLARQSRTLLIKSSDERDCPRRQEIGQFC